MSRSLPEAPCQPIHNQRMQDSPIRVGFTEAHGMVKELCRNPPDGVQFSLVRPLPPPRFRLMRSPIKGYFGRFESDEVDLIEAVMSPIYTNSPWVCVLSHFAEACAFDIAGVPIPRSLRVAYVSRLFAKPNFRKLIVWSNAAY